MPLSAFSNTRMRREGVVGSLDQRVTERISGNAWGEVRDLFYKVSDALLAVSDSAYGELTTIYVKYKPSPDATAPVYAVVWIKSSKQLIVGLALPDHVAHPTLGKAPQGAKYKGLTKYLTVRPGDQIPDEFSEWARTAFDGIA